MKKSLIASLAGAAAVALLSACSPMPSTAAVVDGVSISEKSVDHLLASCEKAGMQLVDGRNTRADVVFFLALGKIAASGGLGEGVAPTREEAVKMAGEQLPPVVLADEECGAFFVENYQLSTGITKLAEGVSQDDALEKINAVVSRVELNPRYGRLKMQESGQIARDSGSLSMPVQAGV